MKRIRLDANFPELPAARAWLSAGGTGSSVAIALRAGIKSLFENPHLKGRHIKQVHLSAYVVNGEVELDPPAEQGTQLDLWGGGRKPKLRGRFQN